MYSSLFVDLDNILFYRGEARLDVLKLRLKAIHSLAARDSLSVHWFCNVDTDMALKKARIVLKGTRHVSTSDVDMADHALVNFAATSRKDCMIISADMSLMRLAMFVVSGLVTNSTKETIHSRIRLRFSSFKDGVVLVSRAASFKLFEFAATSDLERFVTTLNLYRSRYTIIPIASKASMIPVIRVSTS